jgi:hypothetical protein
MVNKDYKKFGKMFKFAISKMHDTSLKITYNFFSRFSK